MNKEKELIFSAPLFRGATKQAMVLGLPLNVFLGITLFSVATTLIASIFLGGLGYFFFFVSVPLFFFFRNMNKADDFATAYYFANIKEKVMFRNIRKNNIVILSSISKKQDKK